jgi:hypothetical protein
MPIFIPSFHPDKISPRDFVEVVNQIRAYFWLRSLGNERWPNGCCFAALPDNPVIPKELIEKMGFHNTGAELWESHGP